MKSFTVTYHHTCNYGATLQAYALQQFLLHHGIENEIMEYETPPQKKSTRRRSLAELIKLILLSILGLFRKRKHSVLKKNFAKFHNEKMKLSRVYRNMDDLRNDPPDADILITGSDQVWNLRTNPAMIPARFLDFGKKDALRISYAASIGNLNYSDDEKEMVKDCLESFDAISLREKSAAEYISSFSGKKCEAVADPVFLLNKAEWNSIAKQRKVCDSPYILCYCVQGNPRLNEVLQKVKAETDYKVVSVNYDAVTRVKADHQLFDISPQEFLGLYSNAAFVITTSFHGTAFALIYEKPFFSLVRNSKDTRISDLLAEVGAEDRAVRDGSIIPTGFANADRIKSLLKDYIGHSEEFIKRALKLNEIIDCNR